MAENSNCDALLLNHHSSRKGGWHAAIFIICVKFAERFAFHGLSANLITYLTNVLHQPVTTAALNVNTCVGVSSLFPLLGGFVADSYLSRFNTIVASCFIYLSVITNAWKDACASATASRIIVHKANYKMGVVELKGPCRAPSIELHVDGVIQAPSDIAQMKGASEWVRVADVNAFTLSGVGTSDGQGPTAWLETK